MVKPHYYHKWHQVDLSTWAYGPSMLDEHPFVVRAAEWTSPTKPKPTLYRAQLGRLPYPFIPVERSRDSITKSRNDAREFLRGHTSYEGLVTYYNNTFLERKLRVLRADSPFPQPGSGLPEAVVRTLQVLHQDLSRQRVAEVLEGLDRRRDADGVPARR